MSQKPGIRSTLRRAMRDFWDDWPRWAMLSLLWLLSWLVILPGPPASFALAYAAYGTVMDGQSYSLRELVDAARQHLGISWLWGALNLVVIIVSGFNLFFYSSLTNTVGPYLRVLYIFLIFLWWCVQFYCLPFYFQMEKMHLGVALRNGLYIALASPVYTLVIAGMALLIGGLAAGAIVPLALGIPGLIALLGTRAVDDRLRAFGIRKAEEEK